MALEQPNLDDNPLQGSNIAPAATSTGPAAAPQTTGANKQKNDNNSKNYSPYNDSIRQWNPLSKFSSYTYNLTLYMMTPDCANYFSRNGKLNPTLGGYYIVAQSGGVNDLESRALTLDPEGRLGPGKPGLDYYIDDVNLEVILFGINVATTATFKITEPQGFTFLTRLSRASNQINKTSKLLNQGAIKNMPNLYQQHYMLGIKFYGYDAAGNVIEASSFPGSPMAVDDKYATYERLFPLVVSKVDFAITGKSTTYAFEATIISERAAYSTKRGFIFGNSELQGRTVGDILGNSESKNTKSLVGWLNNNQQALYDNKSQSIVQKFDIDWGEYKGIRDSNILTDGNYEPESAATSPAVKTSKGSNPSTSKNAVTIDKNSVMRGISPNSTIVSVIEQIITKSSYLKDALTQNKNSRIEADTVSNDPTYLQWFTINPIFQILGRDDKAADWAYDITYQIRPLQVPYIRSPYVKTRSKYYGPIKKYSYTFTGDNTEIINFEMTYNNLFYVAKTDSPINAQDSQQDSTAPSAVTPSASSSTTGGLNASDAQVNSVRASLVSPTDQATATLTIIGDPDFLMTSIGYALPRIPRASNQEASIQQFYGIDGSISPYFGQVYVEIIFKVAEDYLTNGLLDVSAQQDVQFYPIQSQDIHNATGLVYKIEKVTSTFVRGKFEQVLSLIVVPSNLLIQDNDQDRSNRNERGRLTLSSDINSADLDRAEALLNRLERITPPSNVNPAINTPGATREPTISSPEPLSSITPANSTPIGIDSSKNPLQNSTITSSTNVGVTPDDDATVNKGSAKVETYTYTLTEAEQRLRVLSAELINAPPSATLARLAANSKQPPPGN